MQDKHNKKSLKNVLSPRASISRVGFLRIERDSMRLLQTLFLFNLYIRIMRTEEKHGFKNIIGRSLVIVLKDVDRYNIIVFINQVASFWLASCNVTTGKSHLFNLRQAAASSIR